MRTKYFEDLEKIKDLERKLAEITLKSYKKFEDYIINEDKDMIDQIIDLDKECKSVGSEIERCCYDLLALQQPVAKDLRFLQMSIKSASNYKRISNHLNQAGIILLSYPLRETEKEFVKLFIENQKEMIIGARDAFMLEDKELAIKIKNEDKKNNKLFEKAIKYLVDLTKNDKIKARELSEKVLFFKYFERLGDRLGRNADFAKRL